MALSHHELARLKWLKKQLAVQEKSKARRAITIAKRVHKLNEPIRQIDADIEAIRAEIETLENKVVLAGTDMATTSESGGVGT